MQPASIHAPRHRGPSSGPALALATALALTLAGCGAPGEPDAAGRERVTARVTIDEGGRIERLLVAMGTTLRVDVRAEDRAAALAASELAVRAIEDTEARLSTWRDDSELSRLNATPVGTPCELSPTTARELGRALELARHTQGAFDPTVGRLVDAWDLRGAGRVPDEATLSAARAASGYEGVTLDGRWATRHNDVRIDAGGFGKGAALDRAAEALRQANVRAATIDFGGQLAFIGSELRYVPVAAPQRRDEAAVEVRLTGGSIATSGNAEATFEVEGQRFGHLLDPRTGRPAPDRGSATVLAPSALDADALATAAFVLGPEPAPACLAAVPTLWLVLRPEGPPQIRTTRPLSGRVRPLRKR